MTQHPGEATRRGETVVYKDDDCYMHFDPDMSEERRCWRCTMMECCSEVWTAKEKVEQQARLAAMSEKDKEYLVELSKGLKELI